MPFEATALGHQGWSVATATTHILIDPLLTPGFGHGGHAGVVYPPRSFDFRQLPAVDAVLLTHEHDDHFDIASLSRIDREVPVYLSCRSSLAARACLTGMGFEVRALPAGGTVEIGDLVYRTFAADHGRCAQGDEWDVFPFVLRQRDEPGWFASSIDVAMPDALVEHLADSVDVGLWAMAHNTTDAQVFDATPGRLHPKADDATLLARVLARRIDKLTEAGAKVGGVLLCGGGWAFEDERAWLNARVFPLEVEALAGAVQPGRAGTWVEPSAPGLCIAVAAGALTRHPEPAAFVRPRPRAQWPDRSARPSQSLRTYAPATARRSLTEAQRLELLEHLHDFARFLYGRSLFGQLHSLRGDGEPEVALRLLHAGKAWTLAYEPRACCFREVSCDDAIADYRSGLECWATDLHALLTGALAPSSLCYAGRARTWNHDPAVLRVSQHLLWMMAHPLRRPVATAALYASLAQQHLDAPIQVAVAAAVAGPGGA